MSLRSRAGFSLIEVLTAGLILAAVLFAFFRLFAITSLGVGVATQRAVVQGALTEVTALLQKYLASGDSRFFAFSGRGPAGDRAVLRVLTPMPGRCADLSTAPACGADTAFLYTHYDKSLSPAVSAVCKFAGPPLRRLLVDASNPTYGPAAFLPGVGFQITPPPSPAPVTYPIGQVTVGLNRFLAVANPPNFSLWVGSGAVVRVPVVINNPPGNVPTDFTPNLPQECINNLRRNGVGVPDVSQLYQVPLQPLVLSQLTGSAAVTEAEIDAALPVGRFPMRLFAAQIRGWGRIILPAPSPPAFGLRGCQFAAGNIACNDFLPYDVSGVNRVRVFEGFRAALQPNDAVEFEILGPAGLIGATCGAPTPQCRILAAASATTIPVQLTAAESISQPSSAGFSFLKQDLIKELRVRLDLGTKQEEFRVHFP